LARGTGYLGEKIVHLNVHILIYSAYLYICALHMFFVNSIEKMASDGSTASGTAGVSAKRFWMYGTFNRRLMTAEKLSVIFVTKNSRI